MTSYYITPVYNGHAIVNQHDVILYIGQDIDACLLAADAYQWPITAVLNRPKSQPLTHDQAVYALRRENFFNRHFSQYSR